MVGLSSPPVASTKQTPKNKADFQAKKKATKSAKTKASGEAQPSTSLPNKTLSSTKETETLQIHSTNNEDNNANNILG
jgi:hypothetical protein